MFKKFIEWLKWVFSPIEKEGAIRPDGRQGWKNLIDVYADDPRPMALKVVSLAQWIIESGRGTSLLSKQHLNYGGIKYRKELEGLATPVQYIAHDGKDTYAKFESDKAFIEGYWRFIARSPYKGWEQYADDSLGFLKHIKKAGYAESPTYVEKVSALFKEAEALLKAAAESTEVIVNPIPDPIDPVVPGGKTAHEDHVYLKPTIFMVDVPVKAHGSFKTKSGRPIGMVHHYTAGHLSPDSKHVINMLTDLGKRGLGCMGMNEKGEIFVPKSLGFDKIGYHAGSSEWLGIKGLNSYLIGMEVCNPGRLYEYKGSFYTWFDCNSDKVPRQGAKAIDPLRVRTWTTSYGKQSKGHYMAFTMDQEKALINFDLWQLSVNPDYKVEFLVGHDEISKSGKQDPGASLSMTMPEYRALIRRLYLKNFGKAI